MRALNYLDDAPVFPKDRRRQGVPRGRVEEERAERAAAGNATTRRSTASGQGQASARWLRGEGAARRRARGAANRPKETEPVPVHVRVRRRGGAPDAGRGRTRMAHRGDARAGTFPWQGRRPGARKHNARLRHEDDGVARRELRARERAPRRGEAEARARARARRGESARRRGALRIHHGRDEHADGRRAGARQPASEACVRPGGHPRAQIGSAAADAVRFAAPSPKEDETTSSDEGARSKTPFRIPRIPRIPGIRRARRRAGATLGPRGRAARRSCSAARKPSAHATRRRHVPRPRATPRRGARRAASATFRGPLAGCVGTKSPTMLVARATLAGGARGGGRRGGDAGFRVARRRRGGGR